MIKLTNYRFFTLTIISHISLLYLVVSGLWVHLLASIIISMIITLFSSTIVYHRVLSHRSWNCPLWYEKFATVLGIFSFTGTPITRTLAHRYHHMYSDTIKDPHSPRCMSLFYVYLPMLKHRKLNPIFVKDLLGNPFHVFIHNNYLAIIIASVAFSMVFFGWLLTLTIFVVPGALCWFNVSMCNILCHSGKTGDKLSQSKILSLFTFGEGFHDHHHNKPTDCDFSNGAGYDPGYYVIKIIEKFNT